MTAAARTWSLAALIAALSMLGPFSVAMYLPAFPAIGREFAASTIALQQTLSAYLFAFGFPGCRVFMLSGIVAGTVAPFASRSTAMLAVGMTLFTLAGFALWLIYQYRARAHLKGLHP